MTAQLLSGENSCPHHHLGTDFCKDKKSTVTISGEMVIPLPEFFLIYHSFKDTDAFRDNLLFLLSLKVALICNIYYRGGG